VAGVTVYRCTLICTDRGGHKRRHLGHADLLSDGWVMVRGYPHDDLYCRTCHRNPRTTPARWQAAMVRIRDAGINEIDISYLPF
jgi:hypothetical protein